MNKRIETTVATTRIEPHADRIVVQRRAEQAQVGRIHVPEAHREKPMEGVVVAVGPGRRNESGEIVPMSVQVGEKVLFGRFSGQEIELDGNVFVIMREEEVLGWVRD